MKETQKILLKMGFSNSNSNVWQSEWFGVFLLAKTATPTELARFIYNRGIRNFKGSTPHSFDTSFIMD